MKKIRFLIIFICFILVFESSNLASAEGMTVFDGKLYATVSYYDEDLFITRQHYAAGRAGACFYINGNNDAFYLITTGHTYHTDLYSNGKIYSFEYGKDGILCMTSFHNNYLKDFKWKLNCILFKDEPSLRNYLQTGIVADLSKVVSVPDNHYIESDGLLYEYIDDHDEIFTPVHINCVDFLSSMPVTWLPAKLIDGLHQLGIVDVNAYVNDTVNKLINELGLSYMTKEDIVYYLYGVLMSIDDNMYLGAGKRLAGLVADVNLPEDNHYFMLGKVMTDGIFLTAFLKASGMAVAEAARALSTAAGSGSLGLLTAETGIGFAVFETAAGAELVDAAVATCVAAAATAGVANSTEILSKDAKKYAKTETKLKPSEILKNNMVKEKIMKFPPYQFATHHIVAWDEPRALGARTILEKYNIDINAAENGVFLPVEDGKLAMNHCSLHTKTYYKNVEKLLSSASSQEEVVSILQKIREQLLSGTFKIHD